MEIEILVVSDCPNQRVAEERLRQALDSKGMGEVNVTIRIITDQADAEQSGFTGSPTIRINGHDPFADSSAAPSMSCRIYRNPDGPAGAPDISELRQALRAAASDSA